MLGTWFAMFVLDGIYVVVVVVIDIVYLFYYLYDIDDLML